MKTIQLEIQDFECNVLEADLLDVEVWIKEALQGKINNVKSRLLVRAQAALLSDPEITSIPASEEGLLNLYFSRPYYKNRSQRDNS